MELKTGAKVIRYYRGVFKTRNGEMLKCRTDEMAKWNLRQEPKLEDITVPLKPPSVAEYILYGGPQLSRQNKTSRHYKLNSRQDNVI